MDYARFAWLSENLETIDLQALKRAHAYLVAYTHRMLGRLTNSSVNIQSLNNILLAVISVSAILGLQKNLKFLSDYFQNLNWISNVLPGILVAIVVFNFLSVILQLGIKDTSFEEEVLAYVIKEKEAVMKKPKRTRG